MDPVLAAMLTETVTIAPYTGHNAYGVPTYGAAVSYPARIQREFQTLSTNVGPQLVEETRLFLDGNAVVDERSRITLPDGAAPPIEGIKPVRDELGTLDHWVVYL